MADYHCVDYYGDFAWVLIEISSEFPPSRVELANAHKSNCTWSSAVRRLEKTNEERLCCEKPLRDFNFPLFFSSFSSNFFVFLSSSKGLSAATSSLPHLKKQPKIYNFLLGQKSKFIFSPTVEFCDLFHPIVLHSFHRNMPPGAAARKLVLEWKSERKGSRILPLKSAALQR